MRVLFLTKYTAGGPSSRYRVIQFLPFLEARGIDATVHALHDDHYLAARYAGRHISPLYLARRAASRWAALATAPRHDVVFIQKEMFPHLLDVPEWWFARAGIKYIVDLDDAIHLMYADASGWRRPLRDKIPRILSGASLVLAGNRYLEAYARRFTDNVLFFPTVVDTARFRPAAARRESHPPVVGWMGTPETVRYLSALGPALSAASRRVPLSLLVVGADAPPMEGVGARSKQWLESEEAADLNAMDIGVMPLANDEWSKGKCALKLLQYMSAGVASVTSPEGSAVEFVKDGENAYFATSDEEWEARILSLAESPEERRAMGVRARADVEARYSLAVWGPRMADALQLVAEGKRDAVAAWSSHA